MEGNDALYVKASLEVDFSKGSLNISGTPEFIERNRDLFIDFLDYLKANRSQSWSRPVNTEPSTETHTMDNHDNTMNVGSDNQNGTKPIVSPTTTRQSSIDKYVSEGVFHIDPTNGNVTILSKNMPGKSIAEKALNISLILAYTHGDKISNAEIVPVCTKYSCYDVANFSKIFTTRSDLFIKKAKKKAKVWDVELSVNGIKEAEKLLDSMINGK